MYMGVIQIAGDDIIWGLHVHVYVGLRLSIHMSSSQVLEGKFCPPSHNLSGSVFVPDGQLNKTRLN